MGTIFLGSFVTAQDGSPKAGLTVNVYDVEDLLTVVDSDTTDANGWWAVTGLADTKQYRVVIIDGLKKIILDQRSGIALAQLHIPMDGLPEGLRSASLTVVIDGDGAAISTGVKYYLEVPFAGVIERVTALADQSGSIVVDIWKDTYANYPPTDDDSITASAPVTISSAIKSQNSNLTTSWSTVMFDAGDILAFNVDSCTAITRLTISLKILKV